MLNIKSKAFKLVIGTLAVVAFSYASAAMDFGTTTLRVGSKGEAVKAVQTCVGATADGSFGPMTKAKVMAWQASMGLTADGVFGAKSKAAAANGCSTTTPPVSQGNCPAGYVAVTPVAPTWAACAMATTTTSGTNGYVTDIASDSSNRVSTVYESEMDKVVAGFRATARLADQTVTRVRVQMKNTDTVGSSVTLGKYITSASLWMDSTKLATMTASQADRSTSDDTYTFNFSGLNAKIAKDQIGRFYVSVSVNGSLDSNDATNANWAVVFPTGGLSVSSPDGSYDTYDAAAGNVGALATPNSGFTFGKFSANGVKAELNLAASNPAATVVTVNNTAATNAVTLLKFTVKATNSNLTLRKVPIQVVSSAANVSAVINTIKLYNGATLLDSKDGSNGFTVSGGAITTTATTGASTTGYIFDNLGSSANMISSGQSAEFTVVADLKSVSAGPYSEGNTLTTSFANADALLTANFSVLDANGDKLTAGATYRTGSAIGNVMTLRINGVNVVMGTATIVPTTTTGGLVESVTYNIPLTVTAFGQTQYVGQAGTLASVTPGTTGAGAKAIAFALNSSSAPATDIVSTPVDTNVAVTSTLTSSDALIENLGYRLDSGSAKHFTLQVILSNGAAAATAGVNYRVSLKDVRTWTDNALSAGTASQVLNPSSSYQTGYQKVK